jgi:2-polyprenyl-6-methoxyphenol hydroxylase-like FAD-dependent oxidoreductase
VGGDRVWLLGDAAHAMTPNQGQGAAMAIEDALAIGLALRPGLAGAHARYVAARHARVRKVQLDSRRLGAMAHWRNPLARAARRPVGARWPGRNTAAHPPGSRSQRAITDGEGSPRVASRRSARARAATSTATA